MRDEAFLNKANRQERLVCVLPEGERIMNDINPWEIEKIIEVANWLQKTGSSAGSTGEVIAAAFVLNKPEYLPDMYNDMVEAWERLGGEWQQHVYYHQRKSYALD